MVTLNSRATIQQQASGIDEIGQPVTGWADMATVWANVRHQSGLESIRADADVSVVKASIRVRFRADVDAGMRVLVSGVAYDINAVLPDAKRQYLDLVCQKVE